MSNELITVTLEPIVQPLVDFLIHRYRTSPNLEYLIPPFGRFGDLESNPNEISIELPDDIRDHEPAMRAVATLFHRSGSEDAWVRNITSPASPPLPPSPPSDSSRQRYLTAEEAYAVFAAMIARDEQDCKSPLRFSLVKRAAWAGNFWQWARYLVIDHIDDDLDVEAATRQISLLIDHVENPENLIPFDAEVRELF